MSLRYALLAILRVGPLSGYDLQKQFSQSVGHVWHAPDSQIYPELRKMETDGLVEGEEQPRGERGTRRLYHVTDAGNQAFLAWMRSPAGLPARARPRAPARRLSRDHDRRTPPGVPPRSHRASGRANWSSGRASSHASTPATTRCWCDGSRSRPTSEQRAHGRLQALRLRGTRRAGPQRDRLGRAASSSSTAWTPDPPRSRAG